MRCPQCGYVLGPLDRECPRCRGAGRSGEPPATSVNVDVDELVREALAGQPGESELDAAIARVAQARHPEIAGMLTDAVNRMLTAEMERHPCSRLEAARRLAQGQVQGEMQVHTTTHTETYDSLGELPPELRERVERMMAGRQPSGPPPSGSRVLRSQVVRKQPAGEPVLSAGTAVAIIALALVAAIVVFYLLR